MPACAVSPNLPRWPWILAAFLLALASHWAQAQQPPLPGYATPQAKTPENDEASGVSPIASLAQKRQAVSKQRQQLETRVKAAGNALQDSANVSLHYQGDRIRQDRQGRYGQGTSGYARRSQRDRGGRRDDRRLRDPSWRKVTHSAQIRRQPWLKLHASRSCARACFS